MITFAVTTAILDLLLLLTFVVVKYPAARRFSYAILANVNPPWRARSWRQSYRRIFVALLPRLFLRKVKVAGVELRRITFVSSESCMLAEDERRNTLRALIADDSA